jgi:flagellin
MEENYMSLNINTNVTAMNALYNLQNTSNAVNTSIQRLSSGLRINNASDDPSGLIISEGLKAQIGGVNQAISNAQDANNLMKTAEGGLSQVNSLLDSIRQLALHAANTGVNNSTAVQADQTQIKSALDSIDRIAQQTQFGNKNLLDGTAGVSAAVTDTANLAGISIGGTFAGAATQAGNVTVTVTQSASRATDVGAAVYASTSSLISTVNGGTTGTGGTMVLNGQSIQVNANDTVQSMLDKINNLASTTGVSAQAVTATGGIAIELVQNNYGSQFKINYAESGTITSMGTVSAGANAVATVQLGTATATFTGGQSTGSSGLQLSDTNGNSILLSEAGNTGLSSAKSVATVTQGSLQFQIGANAGQNVQFSLGNVASSQLGTTAVAGLNLRNIDVTTAQGASNALSVVDQAIQQVSVIRAQMGAFQTNTLNSAISSLGISAQNLSASESQVADTNVAQEVVNLTKNQILQQAGMSVLAQANQSPQMVLKLLP